MDIKRICIISIMIMIVVFYFIWSTNRQIEVVRNELPPLKIKGVVQEKGNKEFSLLLSDEVENLSKGTSIIVSFSDEVFDESNIILKDPEIHLYLDSFKIGENISIFYPMDSINNNKQIEISRMSNIIKRNTKDENEKNRLTLVVRAVMIVCSVMGTGSVETSRF